MDTSGYKNFKLFKKVYGNTPLYKVIRDNMLEIIGVDDCRKWVYEKTHSVLHHKCLQSVSYTHLTLPTKRIV